MSFRIRNLAVPGLFTVGALYASQVWLYKGFFVDDPFITFRFVKQWTNGNGLVYNVGERVEGYSNFLWTLMLAPFDLLGVDLVLASKLLGIALGLLTVLAIYSFSQRFESRWISALLLVASGPFAAWTVGGLETPLFALLLTLSVCAFVREEDTTRGSLSGILFGLLSLARPEGLGFAAVAVAFRFSRLVQSGSKPNRQDLYRGLGLVMISVPYHLWRLYYNDLPPGTSPLSKLDLGPFEVHSMV